MVHRILAAVLLWSPVAGFTQIPAAPTPPVALDTGGAPAQPDPIADLEKKDAGRLIFALIRSGGSEKAFHAGQIGTVHCHVMWERCAERQNPAPKGVEEPNKVRVEFLLGDNSERWIYFKDPDLQVNRRRGMKLATIAQTYGQGYYFRLFVRCLPPADMSDIIGFDAKDVIVLDKRTGGELDLLTFLDR